MLDVKHSTVGPRVVVELGGELDLSSAGLLEDRLRAVEVSAPELVIDLRALQFMDSTGLRLLIGAQRRADRAGRRLALVPGPPRVHRLFEVTRLAELFVFQGPAPEGEPDG